ncbi:hypothetical protein CH302_01090 [Rhodococcus sp. 15-2388-1-1a]|uniref:hypothetical protein n=1 Tax=Nocardiaceae TaxID=85025 RepID=UPI0005608562|nr:MULTISPECIES: hypothetical protein [Rhodococcus]OZF05249.1 hypothetical protein CH302_01090 [Rhodococcus sp. 15-2388-1-1a]
MVNVGNSFVATPPIDGGVLHSADLGTLLPTKANTALAPAFLANDHGAVGENGLGINKSRTTQKIRMFGGETFREVQTEYDESITVTLLEDDLEAVLVSVFGEANVEVDEVEDDGLHKRIYHTSETLPIKSWILDAIDGEKTKRYVVEKGQVTQTAEVTDVHSNVTNHQITITTYKSALGAKGENVLELRHDASVTSGNP